MQPYNALAVEKKWQDYWEQHQTFKAETGSPKPKFYGLIEFPYPSGSGMHVGHIKAYCGLEIVSRMKRLQGYNVLFPIGFDAYGLPTENTAVKTGVHPRVVTDTNKKKFTQQIKSAGFSFDWSRVIDTTEEGYYKWTQWIFLKMFEHGLVFRDKALVNYCPHCKVVLSNEDSQGGKCDICKEDVVQREKDVWYLRITQYADRLLQDLETVDYPTGIKVQQQNWIGKSTGAFVNFSIANTDDQLKIYTTRPDTLYGVTFMVIAPEHPVIEQHKDMISNMDEINDYKAECAKKTEFERTQLSKDKTGVCIKGLQAVNPLTGKEIPIYISDYVMMGYGTGAIMAVPAHDQRDYEFAKKFGIDIIEVIKGGDISKEAYIEDGEMVNSGELNGITNKKDAIAKVMAILEENGWGEAGVQYKMKDWAFNRQRYWGEPIPLVHCKKCGVVAVPYSELPLKLPQIEQFEPGTDGQSPLAKVESFVNCKCPKCGGDAKRETDTMPQWAGSSWYFLRYCDPHNENEFASMESLKYWMPVDWYNGGMEHVTRHMIYSRFWHKFLYDIGVVNTAEPYAKRTAQGLVLGPDGEKMSKTRGNVIDPNDIIEAYGADVLRLYVLFMGDYAKNTPWSMESVTGVKRFLDRVWELQDCVTDEAGYRESTDVTINKAIKKVTNDILEMKFNTAVATLMSVLNTVSKTGSITKDEYKTFLTLLYPFAPHITEELAEIIGVNHICESEWPAYDEDKCTDEHVEIVAQINGKIIDKFVVPVDAEQKAVENLVKQSKKYTELVEKSGKTVVRVVYITNRLINYVVK